MLFENFEAYDVQAERKKARELGMAEGLAEGRATGLAEGRAEGRAEGHAEDMLRDVLLDWPKGGRLDYWPEDRSPF